MTTLIVYCACPDAGSAEQIAGRLVDERLAACVTRIPGVASTYRWNGRVESAAEHLLVIKTTGKRFAAMQARLLALHPYEVPEIIAVPVAAGHAAYLKWIDAETAPA